MSIINGIGPQAGASSIVGGNSLPSNPTFRQVFMTPGGQYNCYSDGNWTLLATGGGGSTGTASILLSSTSVNLNEGASTKQPLYTVPANKKAIITQIVIHQFSAAVGVADIQFGWNSGANDFSSNIAFVDLGTFSTTSQLVLQAYNSANTDNILNVAGVTGAAGNVFGAANGTAKGSALTCIVDVFGYLTNTSGVPQANINVP